MTTLLDKRLFKSPDDAVEFIGNVLEASTEYSMIGSDLSGTILLWNQGARRLYGYEADEVIGQSKSMLHVPADIERGLPEEMLRTALENGKWEGTVDRQRKSGDTFTARVVVTPRRDNTGEPTGFLLISKDVSDEVRLTEELQETQAYTRSLIESNIDALMTTDPLGVITDVNQQMESLTGHDRDELIGTPFIRLVLQEGKVTNYERGHRGLCAGAQSGWGTMRM